MFYLDQETRKRYRIGTPFTYGDVNYTYTGASHNTFMSLGFVQVIEEPMLRPSVLYRQRLLAMTTAAGPIASVISLMCRRTTALSKCKQRSRTSRALIICLPGQQRTRHEQVKQQLFLLR